MKSPLPIGVVRRRSSVPVWRSRRVATEVTRNMTIIGKTPSRAGPMASKTGRAVEDPGEQPEQHAGDDDERAMVRWSVRTWRSTRPEVATASPAFMTRSFPRTGGLGIDEGEEGGSASTAPVCSSSSAGVTSARTRPSRSRSSRSQRVGLVHDVARHDERVAAAGEVAEEVPEVAAQHRVEARRSARRARAGSADRGARRRGRRATPGPRRGPGRAGRRRTRGRPRRGCGRRRRAARHRACRRRGRSR